MTKESKGREPYCQICKKEVVWINWPDVHYNLSGSVCTGHSDKQIVDFYVRGIPQ